VIETAVPAAVRVHEHLRDIAPPATRRGNAPDDLVRVLQRLPEKRYASPDIVTETIGMLM